MTLTSVVFPAPLGPIRPWIDPCSTSSDTPSTARTPPKCRWTLSSRRSTDSGRTRPPPWPDDGQSATTYDALRPEDDHRDEEDAGKDVDIVLRLLEDPGQAGHHQRTDHGSQKVSAAAKDSEGQNLHRACDAVRRISGINKKVQMRFKGAGEPGQDRAQDERDHLVAGHVDPLAQRRELVLADRCPRSV